MIPFTVYMPTLFESFVAEWLKHNVPEHLKVKAQHTVRLAPDQDLKFRIDLVLIDKKTKQPLAVLDTKYKRSAAPEESDIQQVVAYAEQMGVDKAYLIYPSPVTRSVSIPVGAKKIVKCVYFDLSKDLDEAGLELLSQILH
jgi:5-methylcytosine-specific restriction enzyme subunit McrC